MPGRVWEMRMQDDWREPVVVFDENCTKKWFRPGQNTSRPHFRTRISSTVAPKDVADAKSGTSPTRSNGRTCCSIPSGVPVHAPMPSPVSQMCGLDAPKATAVKPIYAATSVMTASFNCRFCEGSSILLCSREAENPATIPTMIPANGPRTLRNGSTRDAPVITQSRTPERLNLLDVHEKADHDIMDNAIVTPKTTGPPVGIPSTLPDPSVSHTDNGTSTRNSTTSARRAVLNTGNPEAGQKNLFLVLTGPEPP